MAREPFHGKEAMLDRHRIDGEMRRLAAAERFSGVIRISQGEEELFSGAYGFASRTWRVANTLDTRFDTASLTKLFTAVATLQLIDQGLLALDTRIIPLLGLADTAISDEVTVFQLLTHSSGIGDDCEEENGEDYEDLWRTRPNYAVTETADFLQQFAHKEPNFPPGEACRYCNCGFVLLGLAVEKLTGLTYRDYVRERIFKPTQMSSSEFFRMDRCVPAVAEGADPIRGEDGSVVAWKRNIYSFPPVGSPDSGAHVTAADLDRFLRAVRSGDLLSPVLTERFFRPQIFYKQHDGWAMHYGLGMWFYVEPDGHVLCCQKEGYNAGVSAVMRYFPDYDINLVILSNMAEGAWDVSWRVHEFILGDVGDADRQRSTGDTADPAVE